MVAVDYALLGIIGVSTLISLFRGFFKEAVSLVTWVLALWIAWRMAPQAAEYLEPWLSTSVLRLWVARSGIVIAVLIAGGLLSWFFGLVLESTGLTGADRSIGMVFGFGRGAIIVGLVIIGLEALGYQEASWWNESKLIPYAAPVADMIRHAADDGLELLDELEQLQDAVPMPQG
jgi:membrane protein required for colicin V production